MYQLLNIPLMASTVSLVVLENMKRCMYLDMPRSDDVPWQKRSTLEAPPTRSSARHTVEPC